MTLIDEPATNVASEEAATSSHKDPEEWLGVGLVGRHGCHGAVDAQLDTPAVTPTAPPFDLSPRFSHQRSNGLWHAFLGSLASLGAKSATLAVTNVLSLRGPLSPPQAPREKIKDKRAVSALLSAAAMIGFGAVTQ